MIFVTFACGHTRSANGSETDLTCQCGNRTVVNVIAPAPRFVGVVTGPHAEFKDLEAKPVAFEGSKP